MAKCWACGRTFQEPPGEEGEHGCPNALCPSYGVTEFEDEEQGEE